MARSRPLADWHRLTQPLIGMLGADSVPRLLAEAVALMAELAGATTAAAFTIEAEQVLEEAWVPGPGPASDTIGRQLKSFALQSVRAGEPMALPPRDGKDGWIQVLLLRAQGRSLGAVSLWSERAPDAAARADSPLETLAHFVGEAIQRQRRDAAARASAAQQKRWFGQLDQQVRVLDRERQKFAAIVNQSDIYAYVVDATNTIRWVNRTMSSGPAPPTESGWPGKSCRDVCTAFASASSACHSCPVSNALNTNLPSHHEIRGSVDGRARTLYLTALPIRGVDGRPQEVLMMMQDLTDLDALRELQRTQQRLGMVVANTPVVLFAIDRDGVFTLSEGRGLEGLGLTPGQVVGQSAFELYRDVPSIVENLKRALAGEEFTATCEVAGADYETRYTPLRDDQGGVVGVIGIACDVTQRRRLEDETRQVQKLEALGRLAGGVAHDFNNSLTTILGYCTLLLHNHPPAAETDRCLTEVRHAAERAAELTRQLLVFSRRPLLESRVASLDLAAADTKEIMFRLLEVSREAAAASAAAAGAPASAAPGAAGGGTLLLVEDEASVRAIAREMLEAAGYTVLEAAGGAEALALAERESRAIDLMITDVVMPGMSGAELAERLRGSRPAMRVLFTSGHSDDAIDQHGVSRTDSAFLQKPFTFESFVAKVREALRTSPGATGDAPRRSGATKGSRKAA